MAQLTEAKLQEFIQASKPIVIAMGDGSGLSFCISAAGTASWKLRYRYAGKARWLTLGRYPGLNLKEAKKRANKERVKLDDGVDPIADKRRTKAALKSGRTFAELVDDFMKKKGATYKESSRAQTQAYLDRDLLPRLGRLRLDEIGSSEIVATVEKVGERSVHVGHRVFEIFSILFKFAVAKHLAKSNPCAGLFASAILGTKQPVRTPVSLTEQELRALFAGLPAIGRTNALSVKIILATAVRKQELVGAKWEHVDFEQALWTLPAETTKNGKEFVIPLSVRVVEWFRELRLMSCDSNCVLPGRATDGQISSSTLNEALGRLPKELRHFTVHDLRRTARSHLGKLGIDVIVAEKILNHTLGGLVEVYDRGDYMKERRHALELWSEFLAACEEGRPWKVTPLRQVA
jgi:integrase